MYKLPREVYDRLKESIEKYGIGVDRSFTFDPYPTPCCLWGHAVHAARPGLFLMVQELLNEGLNTSRSDNAVIGINMKKGKGRAERVTWEEYNAVMQIEPMDI
jgi:hypothetical protein